MPNATINNPDNFLTTGESRGFIFSRITLSDPDAGEAYFSPIFVAQPGNFGTLTFGTNPADPFYQGQGFLTYQFGNAEFLRRGESIRDTFTIASVDGTTTDVTFTIIGENDPATIGDAPAKDVWVNRTDSGLPDGYLVLTGTISVTDPDRNESSIAGTTYSDANLGRFLIRSDGSYQYVVANAAVQYLTYGQTRVESVNVFSLDSTSRVISFTIHGPDASPIITSGSTANLAENSGGVAYQAAGSDPEGATLTWSLSGTDVARFSVNGATGAVSFLASPNFEAPTDTGGNNVYDITVTASDGVFTTSQAVAITVTDVNDNAPVVTSGAAASVAENSAGVAYQAAGSDADAGTTLTWTLGGADGASFDISASGAVTFKTAPDFETPADAGGNNVYDITVTASDGTLTTSKDVAVTITNLNEAPSVTSGATASMAENATGIAYQASGTDPDAGTALAWTLGGADAGLFDIDASGAVTFKAAPDFEAPADAGPDNVYDITVTASDGTLSSAAQAVAITVTGVNEAPAVTSGAMASFTENATGIVYQATGSDPDAATTLGWTLGGADAALFDIDAGGAVTFRTAPDFDAPADAGRNNVYDITVTASDGALSSAAKAVAITVTNLLDGPTLSGFGASAIVYNMGFAPTLRLLDNDVTFTCATSLAGGHLSLTGVPAEDQVLILSQGNGAGEISVTGSTVSYGGVAFGTAVGGIGTNLNVTFTDAVTSAAVDALIESLAYSKAALPQPQSVIRTLTIDVVDGAGNGLPLTAQFGQYPPATIGGGVVPNVPGAFGAIAVPNKYGAYAFADFDGDGRLDLVSGEREGSLLAWRNTGTAAVPAFTALTGPANPFGGITLGTYSKPALVDLDGDGLLDLVASGASGAVLAWHNAGTSSAPVFTALDGAANPLDGINVGFSGAPSFVDWDGDGDADLVSGGGDGMFRAWRNTGSAAAPVFTALTGAANPFNGLDAGDGSTPAFLDIDGDGDLDLISSNTSGSLSAWRNDGTGALPVFTSLTGPDNPVDAIFNQPGSNRVTIADFDGDGDGDLFSSASNDIPGSVERTEAFLNRPAKPTITIAAKWFDGFSALSPSAPDVTSAATVSVAENASGSFYKGTATDADGSSDFSWTLGGLTLGGTDAAFFTLNRDTGRISFTTAPNFEAPADAGRNNVYNISIIATDGTFLSSAAKRIAITVTDVNEAPSVTSGVTASVAENASGIAYQASGTDPDAGTILGWTLGGADAALFDIDGGTGAVSFKAAPNFEAPADAGGNNIYDITVTASDGTLAAGKAVAITVTDVNDNAPNVTSGAAASVAENSTGIAYQAAGSDADAGTTLAWTLGGTDAALFEIDAGTGAVSFKAAPNFEAPADAGGNNIYDLSVIASDGVFASSQDVAITVTDVPEAVKRVGGIGGDSLVGTAENDTLLGLGGADTLRGNDGADLLNGGAGADSMDGGAGNDVYVVNDAGDTVREAPGGGTDRVVASLDWTLGSEFERLVLAGTADIDGTGNDLANVVVGNAGRNILDGGEGNDVLLGRAGNDMLRGGGGADVLEGGAGADSLEGGLGQDRYAFRSAGDADGDMIVGFSVAERDRIDLRLIDTDPVQGADQGFAWIGGASFGGVAGQLRFAAGLLEGDLDGDGAADFQIALVGIVGLTAGSILL